MPFSKTDSVGMSEEDRKKDSSGWKTTVEMVTGGTFDNALTPTPDKKGAEVGNPYDGDPMGEDYEGVTY